MQHHHIDDIIAQVQGLFAYFLDGASEDMPEEWLNKWSFCANADYDPESIKRAVDYLRGLPRWEGGIWIDEDDKVNMELKFVANLARFIIYEFRMPDGEGPMRILDDWDFTWFWQCYGTNDVVVPKWPLSSLSPEQVKEEYLSGIITGGFNFSSGPGLEFVDAQAEHLEHGENSHVYPLGKINAEVKVGTGVRVRAGHETFWTIVTKKDGDDIEAVVDNVLSCVDDHGLHQGDEVEFQTRHVYDCLEVPANA
jgi:hypothetical protein